MKTEFEYMNNISELLEKVYEVNKENIKIVAEKFAETVEKDNLIQIFGTGHSSLLPIEMYSRAGGFGNVNPMSDPDTLMNFGGERSGLLERTCGIADIIYEIYQVKKEDLMIVISNSGRNAMPIEMAKRAKEEGNFVVVLTSYEVNKNVSSRHPSGKKLSDYADIILDNCAGYGDVCMNVEGYDTGAVSTITGSFILHTIETEATKILTAKGFKPYIYQSQNIDGYDNTEVGLKFKDRIKHLI